METEAATSKKVVVIANPVAGRALSRKLATVSELLTQHGYEVHVWKSGKRGDNRTLAREAVEQGPDMIVVAGGDGTINEVINGMAFSSIPLGLLPIGTVNVLAKEIGISSNPKEIASVLIRKNIRTVCLGKAGQTYFSVLGGVGIDADVVRTVNPTLKRYTGRFAYVVSSAKQVFLSLFSSKPAFSVVLNNDAAETYQAHHVIIGKGRYYAGRFKITPDTSLESPWFDVCLFQRHGFLTMLRYAWGTGTERHLRFPDVIHKQAETLTFHYEEPVSMQLDGDFFGQGAETFTVTEPAIKLIVP